jgi:hypothetical protein
MMLSVGLASSAVLRIESSIISGSLFVAVRDDCQMTLSGPPGLLIHGVNRIAIAGSGAAHLFARP